MASKKLLALLIALSFLSLDCSPKNQVQWTKYTPEALNEIHASGFPMLGYFYAAWCPPCHQLRRTTFQDPRVVVALESVPKIKFDLSFRHSEKVINLHRQYKIGVLPTMIFFDGQGNEIDGFRIPGYIGPDQFLMMIEAFKRQQRIR